MPPLTVHAWPEQRKLALRALAERQLVIVSIASKSSADKAAARNLIRQQIRAALTDLLCSTYHCSATQINLKHVPGQAPNKNLQITLPDYPISISISHEQGLSIAAIYHGATVGVDLVRIDDQIEWQAVAQLYLGKRRSEQISDALLSQQASCFAFEWAVQEAKLKCHGRALTEWSPQLASALEDCTISTLNLPQGYAGALALRNP